MSVNIKTKLFLPKNNYKNVSKYTIVVNPSRLYDLISQVISPGMFFQLLVTAINMCTSIVLIIFFVDDFFQKVYFFVYFLAMPLQIFFCCFYGSAFALECNQLTTSIYSCNWIYQSKSFQKDIIIFAENSLRTYKFYALGFVSISIETFVSVMKSTYSLFAVLSRMKS